MDRFSCEIIFGQLLETFGEFFLVTLLARENLTGLHSGEEIK